MESEDNGGWWPHIVGRGDEREEQVVDWNKLRNIAPDGRGDTSKSTMSDTFLVRRTIFGFYMTAQDRIDYETIKNDRIIDFSYG